MRVVLAGGTGQLGNLLATTLAARGHEPVVLSRNPSASAHVRHVTWDGRSLGPWAAEVDGAGAIVNLAGRSVNCRYTEENLAAMMSSRVDSTRVIGEAIAQAKAPPATWLQMSTATIYAHRFDAPNDEANGTIGGHEPDAPAYWKRSIDIALAWERTLAEAPVQTRRVALRAAMVMSPDRDGVFDALAGLVRWGLGGPVAGGKQWMSWIHDRDFVESVSFLLERSDLEGPFNLAAPEPVPQAEFMATLRRVLGRRLGLPAAKWMAEVGAFVRRSDTELLFKSRRVVPTRLLEAGFRFAFPTWEAAAGDLASRYRALRAGAA